MLGIHSALSPIRALPRIHLRLFHLAANLRNFILLNFVLIAAACSGESDPPGQAEDPSFSQWALPHRLREISGLALSSDERLFAVTDEEAVVYELDFQNGGIVKAFALGRPTLRGDFEGIAILDNTFWLMTSDGELYATREGSDGERVNYQRHDTDLGDQCEFEGLAAIPVRNSLALICKQARKQKGLRIFEWTVAGAELQKAAEIDLREKAMEKAIGRDRVNPSGLAYAEAADNWLVVAAKQNAIFELSRDGEEIDVIMRLDPGRHRQAEGIAVTSDGRLLVADEGGNGRARLAVYQIEDWEIKLID